MKKKPMFVVYEEIWSAPPYDKPPDAWHAEVFPSREEASLRALALLSAFSERSGDEEVGERFLTTFTTGPVPQGERRETTLDLGDESGTTGRVRFTPLYRDLGVELLGEGIRYRLTLTEALVHSLEEFPEEVAS